jgi:hypothetical protein
MDDLRGVGSVPGDRQAISGTADISATLASPEGQSRDCQGLRPGWQEPSRDASRDISRDVTHDAPRDVSRDIRPRDEAVTALRGELDKAN